MGYKVAVVGATGNVGREMLNILGRARLSGRRGRGARLAPLPRHGGVASATRTLKVKALDNYDFSDTDICLMSAGGAVSKEWSPRIGAQGCVVIDNSSAWRYDQDVPLIVPEVNASAIAGFAQEEHHRQSELLDGAAGRRAEAAARPRHDQARRRLDLSVGLRRRQGRHGRAVQRRRARCSSPIRSRPKKFPKRIAFNVIPQIDVFMEDGFTKEEWKMVAETKKILDPKIKLTATCVRVPVFIGHSEAVNIEFEKPITAEEARDILREAPGCLVIDKREPAATSRRSRRPARTRPIISRIREDIDRRERPVDVDRLRQSAQGRGAQRRADRRDAWSIAS